MTRLCGLILVATSVAAACSGDGSPNPTGTAGTGGGTAGTGGTGGATAGTGGGTAGTGDGTAGTGGTAGTAGTGGGTAGTGGTGVPFMALAPCIDQGSYETGTTVTFPSNGLEYAPKCLKVTAGASVTFNGDFSAHPLASSSRGSTGSPLPPFASPLSTGTTASFTFTGPGFYPYWCIVHGSDSGMFMSGVVWAQ